MFGPVRSYAEGSEAQWRPKVKAAQLAAFSHFHCVLHRARKRLAQALANLVERYIQRNRARRTVKYQTCHGQVIPVPAGSVPTRGTLPGRSHIHHAIMSLLQRRTTVYTGHANRQARQSLFGPKLRPMSIAPSSESALCQRPSWEAILAAHARIAPIIHRTPILTSTSLNAMTGAQLFFKCENLQKTGSFKLRGASNAILSLTEKEVAKGIVTQSS